MKPTTQQIEELLEDSYMIWERNGSIDRQALAKRCRTEDLTSPADILLESNLLTETGAALKFTPEGQARAELVIRHHRLAERLLHDVLRVPGRSYESAACAFEHCLDAEVTESVCTLLGHPTTCPHGKNIPPGPCCKAAQTQAQPVLMSLRDLPVGRPARLAYVVNTSHHRLDHLSAVGLLPGVTVQVHQRSPAFVIDVGQTSLALDEQIVSGIYVRPLTETHGNPDATGSQRGRRRRRRGRFMPTRQDDSSTAQT